MLQQRALADQLQAAAADRAHLLVERHTQRVPVETEHVGVELVVLIAACGRDCLDRVLRRLHITFAAMTADDVRPTILSPLDLLD